MNESYLIYQVIFSPEPHVTNGSPVKEYDTLDEAKKYLENPDPVVYHGAWWMIVKKPMEGNRYELAYSQKAQVE